MVKKRKKKRERYKRDFRAENKSRASQIVRFLIRTFSTKNPAHSQRANAASSGRFKLGLVELSTDHLQQSLDRSTVFV